MSLFAWHRQTEEGNSLHRIEKLKFQRMTQIGFDSLPSKLQSDKTKCSFFPLMLMLFVKKINL